jgi:DNA-binding CsgD family transcriptional regulator
VKTYTIRAKRRADGWELRIPDVGVTHSRSIVDADRMAREYVSLVTGADSGSFDLDISPDLGGDLDDEVRSARRAVHEAERLQLYAVKRSREVAARLRSEGLSGRDIAAVLQVSPQRVSKLLRDDTASNT